MHLEVKIEVRSTVTSIFLISITRSSIFTGVLPNINKALLSTCILNFGMLDFFQIKKKTLDDPGLPALQ